MGLRKGNNSANSICMFAKNIIYNEGGLYNLKAYKS